MERWGYFLNYITTKEMAIRRGFTTLRIQVLCEQVKIAVVACLGKVWTILCDAKKLADGQFHKSRGGLENGK